MDEQAFQLLESAKSRPSTLWKLMTDECSGIATLLYGLLGIVHIMAQEIFPLWAITDPQDGGLNLSLPDVGTVIVCAAPFQILTQLFLFPRLAGLIGYKQLFQRMLLITILAALLTPEVSRFSKAPRFADDDGATPSAITRLFPSVLAFVVISCSSVLAFTSTFVLINNSCRRVDRGTTNGIGQSYVSLGRTIGPAVGGAIFAWSASGHRPWPFDFHFAWYSISIVGCITWLVSRKLPTKVNQKLYED